MQIRAAVAVKRNAPFEIRKLDLESPRDQEVLVRIRGVGLCHTDLVARDQFLQLPLPAVFGHEGSGIVEAIGSGVEDVAPGDPVVLSFGSCGHCARCHEHLPCYCHTFPQLNFSGSRPDGTTPISESGQPVSGMFFGQSSFASHAIVPRRNIVKVDAEAPIEILGPLGCGIQTGVGSVLNSLDCQRGTTLAIFGGGTVGLSAVMGARIRACRTIIVVEPVEQRRRLALELGATHVIDPYTAGDLSTAIRNIEPTGLDYALDTSGAPSVLTQALAMLGSHGMLGLVGVPPNPSDSLSINLSSAITFGHQIKGIIEGDSDPQTFIPELVRLFRTGRLPFDRLIRTFPLSQINDAIAAHKSGSATKVVLLPET